MGGTVDVWLKILFVDQCREQQFSGLFHVFFKLCEILSVIKRQENNIVPS